MRIVGGTARGRVLQAPQDAEIIRPTADRVRETIFNVLGQTCEDLEVLDLFSGTGALALEAISRGATRATCVDSGKEALALIAANAESLGFSGQLDVLAMPVTKGIQRLRGRGFNLVFSDPPYKLRAAVDVLTRLELERVVAVGGVVVLEYSKAEPVPDDVGLMHREDERTFGDTIVSIFRLTSSTP